MRELLEFTKIGCFLEFVQHLDSELSDILCN